jgi:hypothetical protein
MYDLEKNGLGGVIRLVLRRLSLKNQTIRSIFIEGSVLESDSISFF